MRARTTRRTLPAAGALLALAAGCGPSAPEPAAPAPAPPPAAPFAFADVAPQAGLARVTWAGRPGKDHLLDSAGTGCALLDFDDDGALDAFVVNGWRLDGARVLERGRHALYRGLGDGRFEDVTDGAGTGGNGDWGCGVAVADQDGDGRSDILVTSFGSLTLYRNRGGSAFTDVAADLGLHAPRWNTGAAFLDADADGDLDLYVAGYIDCTLDDVLAAERTLDWKGRDMVAFGPFGLEGAPDAFFRQGPDGRYADDTEASGCKDKALGFGLGVRALDFDEDGDSDVYVANDSDPNYLYRNEGGRFTDVAFWAGAAFDAHGAAQASMGVTAGDADGDGLVDLFCTHFSEDYSTLYRGLPGGLFEDQTVRFGLKEPTYMPLSWGTAFADLDADADLDLVVVNGHIYPQVDRHPEFEMRYLQPPLLLENLGGRFRDASGSAGPGFATPIAGRGLATGDVDGDGDLDLLLTQMDGPPLLLRNDGPQGHWLMVDARVAPGSGPLVGTRIRVTAGGRTQQRDVQSGESYVSAHDPRAHFGLGTAARADEVLVLWPDGTRTRLTDVAADQVLRVTR